MFMAGTTMHKPAFRPQEYQEVLNFGKHGTKTFSKPFAPTKHHDGHWPHGNHFHGDTDIYRTTMAILMLEVYYRYMPTGNV